MGDLIVNSIKIIKNIKLHSINQNKVDLDNYFKDLTIEYINSPLTNLLISELGMKNKLPINDAKYLKCQTMYKNKINIKL